MGGGKLLKFQFISQIQKLNENWVYNLNGRMSGVLDSLAIE